MARMSASIAVAGLLVALILPGAGHAGAEVVASEQPGKVVRFKAIGLSIYPLGDGIWRHVTTAVMESGQPIPANGLIVTSGDEAILIDTGWNAGQTAALLDWVEQELLLRPIGVVATHHHADCIGGIEVALDRGLKTWGWSGTAGLARADGKRGPELAFDEHLTITVGDLPVELYYPGAGHAPDNIVAWLPGRRLLFAGCLVKSANADHIGYTGDADLAAWPATLDEVRARYPDVRLMVPGHGAPGAAEPMYDNTLQLIQEARP